MVLCVAFNVYYVFRRVEFNVYYVYYMISMFMYYAFSMIVEFVLCVQHKDVVVIDVYLLVGSSDMR